MPHRPENPAAGGLLLRCGSLHGRHRVLQEQVGVPPGPRKYFVPTVTTVPWISIYTVMHGEEARRKAFEAALSGGAYQSAWRYAWCLSRTREDAEDLLQDALAHAFTHHAQLRDSARFCGWLLSIVRTTHLLRLRSVHSRDAVPISAGGAVADVHCGTDRTDGGGGPAAPPMPHGLAALPPQLAAALLALPGSQREVLELFYLQELELVQVARVLGSSPAAAKLRLFRAREALRRRLSVPGAVSTAMLGGCDGRP